MSAVLRDATTADIAPLAQLWFDGWQEAHARTVPAELARVRTRESFAQRLGAALAQVRIIAADSGVLGFHLVKGAELYQLYVAAAARGTGTAARLIADAEARLWQAGIRRAWLDCAIGNERAARFYEKSGWSRAATVTTQLEVPTGTFALEVWRYEKSLRAPPPA